MEDTPIEVREMSEFSVKEKLPETLEMMESRSVTKITAASDEIFTPKKLIQPPRRSRVAFSVKEVKEVALGLQSPHKGSTDPRADLSRSGDCSDDDDDLLAVEEDLKSASSSSDLLRKSSKTRSPTKKLPDKYEILLEFFNSMECSIRLVRLKRSVPTFVNICSSIQHLTGRRFTYGHLAQLKYILLEAISIKKVLLLDESTCCMKPELQIYLRTDTTERSIQRKEESGYSILRKVFRQCLLKFSREHPEVDDIPEDELPYPFGHQTKPNTPPDIAGNFTCSMPINSTDDTQQVITMASHIPKSFQRRFSQKTLIPDAVKTSLVCFDEVAIKDDSPVRIVPSPIKCTSKPIICKKPLFTSPVPKPSLSSHGACKQDRTLINADTQSPQKLNYFDGTPVKFVSTPARLMTATPELQTPNKNCPKTAYDTPVKEPEKQSARTKLLFSTPQRSAKTEEPEKQSARTKLLFSTPQRSAKTEDSENVFISVSGDNDDVITILPETLLQEIREKERKAEERDTGAVEARKHKEEMVASLPKFFDMILLIFQSGNLSFITKQELVQKIIAGYLYIVDRTEVEQQLKLLQELAPDWISAKMVSTGDFLYSVDRISCPQEIRQRLAEAKITSTFYPEFQAYN